MFDQFKSFVTKRREGAEPTTDTNQNQMPVIFRNQVSFFEYINDCSKDQATDHIGGKSGPWKGQGSFSKKNGDDKTQDTS